MVAIKTLKSGLKICDEGTRAWHAPLNDNFERLDAFMNESAAMDLTEIQATLKTKADAGDVAAALALKAATADVNAALALKANASDVANSLTLKANKTDVANSLALKADKTELTALAATVESMGDVDFSELETAIAAKADGAATTAALALKADKSVVDGLVTSVADNRTEISTFADLLAEKLDNNFPAFDTLFSAYFRRIAEMGNSNCFPMATTLYDGVQWIAREGLGGGTVPALPDDGGAPQIYGIPFPFSAPIADYGSGYCKFDNGLVFVWFSIETYGTFGGGEIFTTLPYGYYPYHTTIGCTLTRIGSTTGYPLGYVGSGEFMSYANIPAGMYFGSMIYIAEGHLK